MVTTTTKSLPAVPIENDETHHHDDGKSLKKYERYVPQGNASLVEDAPGWHGKNNNNQVVNNSNGRAIDMTASSSGTTSVGNDDSNNSGPVCWKCRGTGRYKSKKSKQQRESSSLSSPSTAITMECSVCEGRGNLVPKKKDVTGKSNPGVITRVRKCPNGWISKGPCPYALASSSSSSSTTSQEWIQFLHRATHGEHVEVVLTDKESPTITRTGKADNSRSSPPSWIPRPGEELCNLVGSWRILQRVGSHRWTTDDLCTAYVAAKEAETITSNTQHGIKSYLDLGTGNASVLQMVTWALLTKQRDESNKEKQRNLLKHCIGIEARSEAVELARRSISFNVGNPKEQQQQTQGPSVHIVHGDFRDVVQSSLSSSSTSTPESDFSKIIGTTQPPKFDLITGTPPYFRVDFDVGSSSSSNNDDAPQVDTTTTTGGSSAVVQNAIIRQGGMPTAMQSAPARCEFRGGIEAYCQAASSVLQPVTGRFVVCENWLNHARALKGGQEAHLKLLKMIRVEGKEGRGTLFCVYVFTKEEDEKQTYQPSSSSTGANAKPNGVEEVTITVRDIHGAWTQQYMDTVLDYMSIPVPLTITSKGNDAQGA